MGGAGLDLDELDAALDGLSHKQKAAQVVQAEPASEGAPPTMSALEGSDVVGGSVSGAPGAPPPPPRRPARPSVRAKDGSLTLPASWSGRTNFDDLFVNDTAPMPAGRGGLEEKVEYFREKLKRSEAMTARFREAWSVRDRELDVLEGMMEQERGRAEDQSGKNGDLTQKLTALEQFLDQKKREFEAYGQKVQAAFAQKDQTEKDLRAEIAGFQQQADADLLEKEGEVRGLQGQIEVLTQELEHEREGREKERAGAASEVQSRDQRIQELETKSGDLSVELETASQELLDTRDALEGDIAVRNEAIDKLKVTIETQKSAIIERDEQIDAISNQLAQATDEATRNQIDLEGQMASLTSDLETLRTESANSIAGLKEVSSLERTQVIEKYEGELETLREEHSAAINTLREKSDDDLAKAKQEADDELAAEKNRGATAVADAQVEAANERSQITERYEGEKQAQREEAERQRLELQQRLEVEIGTRDDAIDKLKSTVETQRSVMREREDTISGVESQLSELRAASEGDASAKQRQIDGLIKELAGRNEEFATLQTERDQLTGNVELRDEVIGKLRSAVETQKAALSERDEQVETLTSELANSNEELTTLRMDTEREIGALAANIESRDGSLAELNDRVQDLTTAIADRESSIRALRDEVAGHKARAAELQQELEKVRDESKNIESHLAESTGELNNSVKVRDEAITKLRTTLEQNKTHISDLETQVEEAHQQALTAHDSAGAERQRTAELLVRTRKALEVAQKLLS
ncbi:MAG: hypothetical protein H7Z43_00325 [Clostridia bacterium]|nr:hypothetical protein [Deltaproteobacteria bacterium]